MNSDVPSDVRALYLVFGLLLALFGYIYWDTFDKTNIVNGPMTATTSAGMYR